MKSRPMISIIFPAKNEGENVRTTLDSLFSIKTDYSFEVIIVDDGSIDYCCDFIKTYNKKERIILITTNGIGAANARNLGAANASGDFLIFCDAHLLFEDWWIDRLIEPLSRDKTDAITPGIADIHNPQSIGFGQTLTPSLTIKWNHKKQDMFETAILPGGCFAIRRSVFEDVRGFETGFRTWGHEDVEFSIKLWLWGYQCHVEPSVTILHLFRVVHPYKISSSDVHYNLLRMAFSHFNKERINKCKKIVRHRKLKLIESQLLKDGIMRQRAFYLRTRKYNDNWYFTKFDIDF